MDGNRPLNIWAASCVCAPVIGPSPCAPPPLPGVCWAGAVLPALQEKLSLGEHVIAEGPQFSRLPGAHIASPRSPSAARHTAAGCVPRLPGGARLERVCAAIRRYCCKQRPFLCVGTKGSTSLKTYYKTVLSKLLSSRYCSSTMNSHFRVQVSSLWDVGGQRGP